MAIGTTEAGEFTIVGEAPGVFRAGSFGRVVIFVWLGRLTTDSVDALERTIHEAISRLHGGRGSLIHILNEHVGLPAPATRPALAKIMQETEPLSCVSIVVEGSGFWASAFRGFITGMRLLGPSSYRIHEHSSTTQVVEWLPAEHEKFTGEPLDSKELEHSLAVAKRWQLARAS